jgi:peptidoglycan hydrolase-like protein with peptidoglycan-binding domain
MSKLSLFLLALAVLAAGCGERRDVPVYTGSSYAPPWQASPALADVQERLRTLGFYRGPSNGALDGATEAALERFQSSRRLPATGTLDAPTVDALREATR